MFYHPVFEFIVPQSQLHPQSQLQIIITINIKRYQFRHEMTDM